MPSEDELKQAAAELEEKIRLNPNLDLPPDAEGLTIAQINEWIGKITRGEVPERGHQGPP